jgi:hypothetical protein
LRLGERIIVPIDRLLAGKLMGPPNVLDFDPSRFVSAPAANLLELFGLGARTAGKEVILESRVACHGSATAITAPGEMDS